MANKRKYSSSVDVVDTVPVSPSVSLEGRYEELASSRQPYLQRAREASKLTIPSLIPPDGTSGTTKLYKPWQSIGARGVNHLSAKILLALLPPSNPFFRFAISQTAIDKLSQSPELKTSVEEGLAKYEKEIMTDVETGSTRNSSFEAIQHLIVAGNCCPYMPAEGGMKVFHLDSYVVVRSPMGDLIELIVEEQLSPQQLEGTLRMLVESKLKQTSDKAQKTVKLHTCLKREGNKFITYQEVCGIRVPGSDGTYPLDASPFLPLRWIKIDGEDYGRGHVESLQGDLQSVEGLSQSVVEGSAAAAKVLFLVNPNGVTKQKTIAEAPNGAIRSGKADDVTVLRVEKHNDFRVALDSREGIKGDLEASFLMNSSIQRQGERVTAAEIRFMASELESALGGVYSLLAQEFQLPLVKRLIAQMIKQKRLKPLPKGIIKPTIITGLEALSRGSDLQRLDIFMQGVKEFGPQVVDQYVNLTDYFTRRATALAIDQKGLIRSEDEVAQAKQQQQMQALISQAAPNAVKALGDTAKVRAQAETQQNQPQQAA